MTQAERSEFDFLAKAALVLFVFQLSALAHTTFIEGGADLPNGYLFIVMLTGLFVGAQTRLAGDRGIRGAAPWLVASRTGVLAILATASLAVVFRDYLQPPVPAITSQAIVSILWVVIALKGAAAGKFRPGGVIGLRIYWTMRSRLAWEKAHRTLGRILFWGGLAGFIASFFVPWLVSVALWAVAVSLGVTLAIVDSWRGWRMDPNRAGGNA